MHGSNEFKERMAWLRPGQIREFDQLYSTVILAFKEHDYRTLSKHIKYPIKLDIKRRPHTIKDRNDFIKTAKYALSDDSINGIISAKNDLACLSKGVMVGDGVLWLNTCEGGGGEVWKIVAKNN